MGYMLAIFNWIIFLIEMSRSFTETVKAVTKYALSFVKTPECKDVQDKVVVVTGAASGLGSEISHRFARLGSQVIMLDIDEKANIQAANELRRMGNNKVFSFRCDVTDESQVNSVAAKILKYFGKVDIVVNNATWWEPHSALLLMESPSESIQKTLTVNLLSHFWITRAFLPSMINKRSGHIVAISSLSGLMGTSKFSSFCASQHGIMGAMSALASELEDFSGIFVSTACPVAEGLSDVGGMLPPTMKKFLGLAIPPQHEIANLIVKGIRENRDFIIVPRGFYVLQFIDQLLPQRLARFALKLLFRDSDTSQVTSVASRITNGNSCH